MKTWMARLIPSAGSAESPSAAMMRAPAEPMPRVRSGSHREATSRIARARIRAFPAGDRRCRSLGLRGGHSHFWLIPDILLGWVALHRPASIIPSVIAANLGALAGGVRMHQDAREEHALLTQIPGITEAMLLEAHERFASQRWAAVIRAPIDGIPYKVYATESGITGAPVRELIVWTPVAAIRTLSVYRARGRADRCHLRTVGTASRRLVARPVSDSLGRRLLTLLRATPSEKHRPEERRERHANSSERPGDAAHDPISRGKVNDRDESDDRCDDGRADDQHEAASDSPLLPHSARPFRHTDRDCGAAG